MTHLHCPPNSFIWQCKLFLMSGYVGFRLQNKPNSGCAYWCTRLSWVSTSQTCWHWSLTALAFFLSFLLEVRDHIRCSSWAHWKALWHSLANLCTEINLSVFVKVRAKKNQWRFFIWTLCIMCLICGLWLKCAFVKTVQGVHYKCYCSCDLLFVITVQIWETYREWGFCRMQTFCLLLAHWHHCMWDFALKISGKVSNTLALLYANSFGTGTTATLVYGTDTVVNHFVYKFNRIVIIMFASHPNKMLQIGKC